jgi:hypothetical protein
VARKRHSGIDFYGVLTLRVSRWGMAETAAGGVGTCRLLGALASVCWLLRACAVAGGGGRGWR